MRVIAGQAKGMRLASPNGMSTRPTSDRVKEALFSILDSSGYLQDALVLDLFAGSGALGIEALSRGARYAVFVENNRAALEALRQNLTKTKLTEQSEILPYDGIHALEQLTRQNKRFSLILMDPPYRSTAYGTAIERAGNNLLLPGGLLVAETAVGNQLPEKLGRCRQSDQRQYGSTALVFYTVEPDHAP